MFKKFFVTWFVILALLLSMVPVISAATSTSTIDVTLTDYLGIENASYNENYAYGSSGATYSALIGSLSQGTAHVIYAFESSIASFEVLTLSSGIYTSESQQSASWAVHNGVYKFYVSADGSTWEEVSVTNPTYSGDSVTNWTFKRWANSAVEDYGANYLKIEYPEAIKTMTYATRSIIDIEVEILNSQTATLDEPYAASNTVYNASKFTYSTSQTNCPVLFATSDGIDAYAIYKFASKMISFEVLTLTTGVSQTPSTSSSDSWKAHNGDYKFYVSADGSEWTEVADKKLTYSGETVTTANWGFNLYGNTDSIEEYGAYYLKIEYPTLYQAMTSEKRAIVSVEATFREIPEEELNPPDSIEIANATLIDADTSYVFMADVTSEGNTDVSVIIGQYDSDGRLVGSSMGTHTYTAGETRNLTVNVEKAENATVLKAFYLKESTLAPLLVNGVYDVPVDAIEYKVVYSREGIDDSIALEYMDDSVVMRMNNNEAYVDNLRVEIDDVDKTIRPYLSGSTVYVPINFVLNSIGANIRTDSTSTITFTYNGSTYSISKTDTSLIATDDDVAYVNAEAFAEKLNLGYYYNNKVVFLNPNSNKFASGVSDDLVNAIRENTAYEWDNLFLGCNGFVAGIVIHPKNPDIMYARTDVGGVYRLNSDGESWTPCSYMYGEENTAFGSMTTSIAIDPNNENIVYAAHGMDRTDYTSAEGARYDLFKSTDYGNTWTRTFFPHVLAWNDARHSGEGIAVDPNNSNIVYVGTQCDGLWRSDDACVNYTYVNGVPHGTSASVNPDTAGLRCVLFDENSTVINGKTSTIYVSVDGVGIYRSTDAGETFSLMAGSPKCAKRMQIVNSELYVAAGKHHMEGTDVADTVTTGVFHYDGSKWNNITPATTYSMDTGGTGYAGIAVNPNNPDMIFISSETYGSDQGWEEARSLDGGETWQPLTGRENWRPISCLVFDPRDDYNSLIETWGFGIYKITNLSSTSSGTANISRTGMYKGIEALCTQKITSIPYNNTIRLIVDEMDYGRTIVKGLTTEGVRSKSPEKTSNGTSTDYCVAQPKFVVSSGSKESDNNEGYVIVSSDYGVNYTYATPWQAGGAMETATVQDVAVSAEVQDNGYPIIMALTSKAIDGYAKGIYRSLDFGTTWELVQETNSASSFYDQKHTFLAADRVNGDVFYCITGYQDNPSGFDFLTTKDGGGTWDVMHRFTSVTYSRTIKAMPGKEGVVFSRQHNKGLYMSEDYGATWTLLDGFTACRNYGFGKNKDGVDYASIYVYGTRNGVQAMYRSDDFAETWVKISDPGNIFAQVNDLTGDVYTYGRVYLCISGSGAMYGNMIED